MEGEEGLVSLRGRDGVGETATRLVETIRARQLTLFARIDHGAGAHEIGMVLRPTILFIFGSARGGTPLLQKRQIAGIDLPLRMLVWEDADGATWITYVDPGWIAAHRVGPGSEPAAAGLAKILSEIAQEIAL